MSDPTQPAYERIRADLRHRIETGELAPGAKLPSHPQLASEYGVSHQPVRQALFYLEQVDKLVVSRQGAGTFVVEDVPSAD